MVKEGAARCFERKKLSEFGNLLPAPVKLKKLAADKLPQIEETIARAQVVRTLLRSASRCMCPSLEVCAKRAEEAGVLVCDG